MILTCIEGKGSLALTLTLSQGERGLFGYWA